MNRRITMYKVYSILVLIFAIISFIFSLVNSLTQSQSMDSTLKLAGLESFTGLFLFVTILIAVLSLFVSYLDFSSVYSFSSIIQYEESENKSPMKKLNYVLSPGLYRGFAAFVLIFYTIFSVLLFIATLPFSEQFPAVTITGLFFSIFLVFYVYIVYYSRYKAFADLYEYLTSATRDRAIIERINSNDTGALKGFGIFSKVIAIILAVVGVVEEIILLLFINNLGVFTAVLMITILLVVGYGFFNWFTVGCYFKDLSNMVKKHKETLS